MLTHSRMRPHDDDDDDDDDEIYHVFSTPSFKETEIVNVQNSSI